MEMVDYTSIRELGQGIRQKIAEGWRVESIQEHQDPSDRFGYRFGATVTFIRPASDSLRAEPRGQNPTD